MKLTTAVLGAGAAVSLTTAVVGAVRLRQGARHQAERNETVLARNQLDWLAQMSTNPDLAKLWTPADMDVEEAEGDEQAEYFPRVLEQAAKNLPRAQAVTA